MLHSCPIILKHITGKVVWKITSQIVKWYNFHATPFIQQQVKRNWKVILSFRIPCLFLVLCLTVFPSPFLSLFLSWQNHLVFFYLNCLSCWNCPFSWKSRPIIWKFPIRKSLNRQNSVENNLALGYLFIGCWIITSNHVNFVNFVNVL